MGLDWCIQPASDDEDRETGLWGEFEGYANQNSKAATSAPQDYLTASPANEEQEMNPTIEKQKADAGRGSALPGSSKRILRPPSGNGGTCTYVLDGHGLAREVVMANKSLAGRNARIIRTTRGGREVYVIEGKQLDEDQIEWLKQQSSDYWGKTRLDRAFVTSEGVRGVIGKQDCELEEGDGWETDTGLCQTGDGDSDSDLEDNNEEEQVSESPGNQKFQVPRTKHVSWKEEGGIGSDANYSPVFGLDEEADNESMSDDAIGESDDDSSDWQDSDDERAHSSGNDTELYEQVISRPNPSGRRNMLSTELTASLRRQLLSLRSRRTATQQGSSDLDDHVSDKDASLKAEVPPDRVTEADIDASKKAFGGVASANKPSRSSSDGLQKPIDLQDRGYYVTPSATEVPRESNTKKVHSVNEGTANLVADVDNSDTGERSQERGGSGLAETERGRKQYHLSDLRTRHPQTSIEDDDAYSYLDARGMFDYTEPRWRERDSLWRPRQRSFDGRSHDKEAAEERWTSLPLYMANDYDDEPVLRERRISHSRRSGFSPYRSTGTTSSKEADITVARDHVVCTNVDEDYGRRKEQVQRELGRIESDPDLDPDRERRRHELEQRLRKQEPKNSEGSVVGTSRVLPNTAGTLSNESLEDLDPTAGRTLRRRPSILDVDDSIEGRGAQIIDNSTSDRQEKRVKIVDPPTKEDDQKPKGILKKSKEKFPDYPDKVREGVAPLKDVR